MYMFMCFMKKIIMICTQQIAWFDPCMAEPNICSVFKYIYVHGQRNAIHFMTLRNVRKVYISIYLTTHKYYVVCIWYF